MFGHRSGRFWYFVRWFFNVLPEWCDSRSPVVETKDERMHDKAAAKDSYRRSHETTVPIHKTTKHRNK